MKYRKEIDGLRALAVVPVILFHAGFASFSGGFVGVDIFFVISGFLITSIIVNDMDGGNFSLINFYERRARRILPALFFMMLCSLPIAWFFMLPQHLKGFSQSIAATPLFVSNILFYLTSDYFDTASELKPLIHTWSLAVEEQYYILFPFFIFLTWKIGKNKIILCLIFAAIVSLIAAHWNSTHHPYLNFFLLPTRAFEILIGALLAFYINNKPISLTSIPLINQTLSIAGLVLIFYSIFSFNSKTPSPSLYTIIPTLGTALIIIFSNKNNLVGKILASKLFVGLGLISYSTYLWHQPLFAFYRVQNLYKPTTIILFILCLISVLIGYLSWLFIEKPFRNNQFITRNNIFKLSFFFSLFFVSLGLFGYSQNGFKDLYINSLNSNQKRIYSFIDMNIDDIWREGTCSLRPNQTFTDFKKDCYELDKNKESILLWGDSHAASLSYGLIKSHGNVAQFTASACPPILDTFFIIRPNCKFINDFVLQEIKSLKPTKIFLLSNWFSYFPNYDVITLLNHTIGLIKSASPTSEISIIGSLPQYDVSIPELMFFKNIELNKINFLTSPYYEELLLIDNKLHLLSLDKNIKFISALDIFCIKDLCQITVNSNGEYEPTPYDLHHLSKAGSYLLSNGLLNQYAD